MTVVVGPLDAVTGAPSYTGQMSRTTWGGGLVGGKTSARPLGGRTGVWPGTPTTAVSVAGTTVTIGVHGGVLDVEAAATTGPYAYAVTVAQTQALNAADATNPRIDLISIQLSDPAAGDGTSTPGGAVVYTVGTAAASPVAPATPARSLVLTQVNVPHSGGGAATTSWVAPYTAAAGGIIPCATSADYPASPYEGMAIYDMALNTQLNYNGGGWTVVPAPADAMDYLTAAPGSSVSTPGSGTATWLNMGNVTIPVWATQALVSLTINGINPSAAGAVAGIAPQLAGSFSATAQRASASSTSRFGWSGNFLITGLAGTSGSQALRAVATFISGTLAADGVTAFSAIVNYLP